MLAEVSLKINATPIRSTKTFLKGAFDMPKYKVWFNLDGDDEEEHIDTRIAIEFTVSEKDSHAYNRTSYEKVEQAAIALAKRLGLSMTWDIDKI